MASLSKRKKLAREKVDATTFYQIDEALSLVKELATSKFPESIDVSVNLGVDPRKSDQVVRGSTVLPAINIDKVGKVNRRQLEDIATTKMPDLTAADMDAAVRTVAGTARSMGIETEGVK